MTDQRLQVASEQSSKLIEELRRSVGMAADYAGLDKHACVYVCGSLGRREMLKPTDLDLFFIWDDSKGPAGPSNLQKYKFFGKMYELVYESANGDEHAAGDVRRFKDPSGDGAYWDFIPRSQLMDIGSRQEDYTNAFTARMLLMLEGVPLYNEIMFDDMLNEIVGEYFKESDDHPDDFHPTYLINDIMRYWYTLALNYENLFNPDDPGMADDRNKSNRMRLKLKFPRRWTCFSMIACLFKRDLTKEYVVGCMKSTPLERLYKVAGFCPRTEQTVDEIVDDYVWYLGVHDQEPKRDWWHETTDGEPNKVIAFRHADAFKGQFSELFRHLSKDNPELVSETEFVIA